MTDHKSYTCICGKIFDNPQKFNGHKSNCKVHLLNKYGNLDLYTESRKVGAEKTSVSLKRCYAAKKQDKLNQWRLDKHVCQICGKVMVEYYGSGRFCGPYCAHTACTVHNRKEISTKVSLTLKNNFHEQTKKQKQQQLKVQQWNKYIAEGYSPIIYKAVQFNDMYIINRSGDIISKHTLQPISPYISKTTPYKQVILRDIYHNIHHAYVHQLVAYTFIPNPNNYPIINHKDEDPLNNCVDNLEWCTYSYNNTYHDVHLKRGKVCSHNK